MRFRLKWTLLFLIMSEFIPSFQGYYGHLINISTTCASAEDWHKSRGRLYKFYYGK
jgi:hypothetical protein